MLNKNLIRKKIYYLLHDSEDGNGTYSHNFIDEQIEFAFLQFARDTNSVTVKTPVMDKEILEGFLHIIKFENQNGTSMSDFKDWSMEGNVFKTKHPIILYWSQALYRINKFGDIEGTQGLNAPAMYSLLFLLQKNIALLEENNKYKLFEQEYKNSIKHIKTARNQELMRGNYGSTPTYYE